MPTPSRRHWLDWQRGLAVLLMVEVHVLDAWLAPDVQRTGVHRALDLLGGLAAPGFLFMAGISVVLADAALERKKLSRAERSARLLRRAGWLLGVALLFRVGEYLLGGMWRVSGGWRDILRVDVLNVIAVSLAVTVCVAVALPRRAQLPVTAALAAAIALASPPLAAWPHHAGPLVDYLLPPTGGEFAFFNWSAFVLAGAAVGLLLGPRDRPLLTLAVAATLIGAGLLGDRAPAFYANQDYWHSSPCWLAIRLGVVVALSGVLQLLPTGAAQRATGGPRPFTERALAPLSLLGRHSLLGYMASVELTYGLASQPLHHRLGTGATLAGIAAAALLTAALALAAERGYPWLKASRSARAASS